jgi:hypothetical protein
MVNGIGPMGQVRNNMAFSIFYNDISRWENERDFSDPNRLQYKRIEKFI